MPTRTLLVAVLLTLGCAPKPGLELNRDRLDFGEVEVGGTYRAAVVLTNPGEASLKLDGISLVSPLSELELEGLPLAGVEPGGTAVVRVVYRPVAEGTVSAVLRIAAADGKGPRELPVVGRAAILSAAVQPEPGASCPGVAGSIDFGAVTNGDAGIRLVTVESTGTGSIAMLKATFSPPDAGFTVAGLAAARSLAPGQRATFTVRYDPTLPGPQSGTLTLETNSFLVPRIEIPICGTGLVPVLCASPANLAFGAVAPGTSSTVQLTATSCGNLPVTLRSALIVPDTATVGGFSLAPSQVLPQTLEPGQSTLIDVRFDSTSALTARSKVQLTSSSPVTPALFLPAGANLPPPCNATFGPTSLHFYKDLAASQPVSLTNKGNTDCLIERVEFLPAGADFVLERPLQLPAVLAARSTMEFTVNYVPPGTANTPTNATLELELDWVHEVQLRGDPRPPTGCHLVPHVRAIDFGLVAPVGTPSRELRLTNVGSDPCTIHGITFDTPGFSSFNPTTTVPPQGQTLITIGYVGPTITARMTISSSDEDQPQLTLPVVTGHVRCDPNCACTAGQTPTFWRFSGSVGSAVTPSGNTTVGAYMESCDPKRCAAGEVAVEVDRGVIECAGVPPDCAAGTSFELQGREWACVPCALIVQYGSIFSGERACAPLPNLSCGSGLSPTFDAKGKAWRCISTCDNGLYDQRTLANGTLVCIPC
ncbi:MAG: choice-of-anchor D domain-containing protein [Archangium sp.]|nr:choice-of-anchor D domain-containing protein [Archangium sp.]